MDKLGTPLNPVHVAIWTDQKRALASAAASLAVVGIAILMQQPALRQAIKMRASYYAMKFCARNVAYWKRMETIASTSYDIARL